MRFGMIQTKLGLACLLNSYKFDPCPEKTPREPVVDPRTTVIVLSILNGIHVKISNI